MEKVKQKLKEVQKKHKQKLKQSVATKKSLNKRVLELEAKVKRLSVEISKAKSLAIIKYKDWVPTSQTLKQLLAFSLQRKEPNYGGSCKS